jgi:hypothetical protein
LAILPFDILDQRRFSYKFEKAGSDYYQIYGQSLIDKLCIEKKRFDKKIINCHLFADKFVSSNATEFKDGVLYYFESLSAVSCSASSGCKKVKKIEIY